MKKVPPKASLGMGKASALKAAAASKQAASNASKAKAEAAASNAMAKATKSPSKPGAGGRLAGAMQGLGNAVKRTAVNSMQRAAGPKSGGSMLGGPGGTPARMGPPPAQRAGASPMQGLGAAAAGAPRPGMKKGGAAKKRYT